MAIAVSAGRGKRDGRSGIIVPVVLVVVLLAGVILLVLGAVDSENPAEGKATVQAEAERLLQRLADIAGSARWVEVEDGPARSQADGRHATLDLLEDLDGDTTTGGFEAAGSCGLERVLVYRDGEGGRWLIAGVYSTPGAPPREVELTGMLDAEDEDAFYVEYLSELEPETPILGKVPGSPKAPGVKADGLRLSVTIRANGETGTFTRVIRFQ